MITFFVTICEKINTNLIYINHLQCKLLLLIFKCRACYLKRILLTNITYINIVSAWHQVGRKEILNSMKLVKKSQLEIISTQ